MDALCARQIAHLIIFRELSSAATTTMTTTMTPTEVRRPPCVADAAIVDVSAFVLTRARARRPDTDLTSNARL